MKFSAKYTPRSSRVGVPCSERPAEPKVVRNSTPILELRELYVACVTVAFLLSACATSNQSQRTVGTGQGTYKVGQPYQVNGNWYYPHEDYSYDETGIASWYGADFHDKMTSNGEIYNKDELTAAHKTLPLPSLARVTNLDNGRSIVVRINDRGPFSGARIIDVSQRSAQLLGFDKVGTAKVRVQVLADESKAIADAMRHYGAASAVASNDIPPEAMTAAPLTAVSSQPLEADPAVKNTMPTRTTPEVHQQLLMTKPVAQYVQQPVVGVHQIFVQAGAFTVQENAIRLQKTLGAYGSTSVSEAVVNGKTFYRVRVGPIQNVDQADAVLAKVRRSGIDGARTVVN